MVSDYPLNFRSMKIFSDMNYVPKGVGHVAMLYPFWGKTSEDPQAPDSGRFDHYTEIGNAFFEMTSLANAELVVMPVTWEYLMRDDTAREMAIKFAGKAEEAGKQIVIFFWSDSDEDVPINNAIIFRTSFYRSKRKHNEFAMPAWSENFVEKYLGGRPHVRQKRAKPVVGFCGYAAPLKSSLNRNVKSILRWGVNLVGIKKAWVAPNRSGHIIRAKALHVLSRSSAVKTNFIIRDCFLGGAILPDGYMDLSVMQKARQEYVENMVESDYILCVRGEGNFSYRIYETLCCGRIPVFINTDCVLPYDFTEDWKKYCVWIEEHEISLISERIAEFHNAFTPDEFMDLQIACHKFWKDWLSPEGFFANFYRHFGKVPHEA